MGHLVPRDPPSAISDMFNQGLSCYTQKNTHFLVVRAAFTESCCSEQRSAVKTFPQMLTYKLCNEFLIRP